MRRRIAVAVIAGGVFAACAHAPPRELVEARVALVTAQQGDTDEVAPEAWRDAEAALKNANEAFAANRAEDEVRDLSYVSVRQTQRAEAVARAEKLRRQRAEALAFLEANDERSRRQIQAELRQTREQLAQLEEQRKLEAQQRADAERQQAQAESEAERLRLAEAEAQAQAQAQRDRELEQERQARLAAEREAAEARAQLEARLRELAQVREEARGTVLTLSGTLLFSPGKSNLLPTARARLDQLADVLRRMPEQKLRIEGHTDSQGSEQVNEALSQRRAETVRQHLIAQGVEAGRIEAQGLGEAAPVADNQTPSGRAQNRRVEIVLLESPGSERGIGGAGEDR